MPTFTLTIETDNASFEHPAELPRIVQTVSMRLHNGETEGTVRDTNGNSVGSFKVS